jgi:hypothetical protein
MKLLLTKELGRLAKWLRIIGFDTVYSKQENLSSLIIQALKENRTIITRNQHLSKTAGAKVIRIKAEKLKEQFPQILKALKVSIDRELMFTRCIICNEELKVIDKKKVEDKVPEYVFKTQESFITCPKCGRIYWQGTHWGNVEATLKEIIK